MEGNGMDSTVHYIVAGNKETRGRGEERRRKNRKGKGKKRDGGRKESCYDIQPLHYS
jgi:hypothetical protein